jgi:hypothetical protein
VPPTAEIPPPTNFALRNFDEAIDVLKRLQGQLSAQFANTKHSGNDLENVASFIRTVMKAKTAAANGGMESSPAQPQPSAMEHS